MNSPNVQLLAPWLRRFLVEYMVSEKNYSSRTRQSYRDAYRLLLPFASQFVSKPVDRLTVEDLSVECLTGFLESLEKDRGCGVRTRNQRLAAISSLAGYVADHAPELVEWCRKARTIPLKKSERREITYFERREIEEIIASADVRTEQGRRDHAVLQFLYNTGARADEAANMKVRDVKYGFRADDATLVELFGKGCKRRTCPLWKTTADELSRLIRGRDGDQPLFVNRRGERITRFGIYELVVRHAKKAAKKCPSIAEKRPSPHTIRHTTATHLLQAGVDINTIRSWLGHVSVDTTNIYAEVDMEMKVKALGKCLPLGDAPAKHWRDDKDLMAFLDGI